MQNTDKSYTFLLSHSSKSRIYFRRVEVSKKLLRNTLFTFGVFFGISMFGIGVFGIVNYTTSAHSGLLSRSDSVVQTQLSASMPTQPNSFDYSRPTDSDSFSRNSGGPASPDESVTEDAEMDKQLQVIQNTSDPAFVPSIWAHTGKINNEFGFRRNPFGGRTYEFHPGMDIDGERGELVIAPANGIVSEAGWRGGYGNMIEIDHGNGLKTRYGHLSKIEVEVGDTLARGQEIALIGSTGRSTGPHLHYEIRLNDHPINPRRFLPPEPIEIRKIAG